MIPAPIQILNARESIYLSHQVDLVLNGDERHYWITLIKKHLGSHLRRTHSFFGGMSQQMYHVDLHAERKAVTHVKKNVQVILLVPHTNIVMETPTIVTRNVALTKHTASVKK